MGPTASGKSELGMGLARALDGEVISVDSALVYRGMDIGSAKPSSVERVRVPHHLIDICDPAVPYSAADFARDAERAIEAIVRRGRWPILVGGTMLYFKALLQGLSPMPTSDARIRAAIEAEAERRGWPAMHAQLRRVDPRTAQRLHPNHSQRIGRALEVYRSSGRTLSEWQTQPGCGIAARYRVQQLALAPSERALLHQRIAQRFDKMLSLGFIEEVRQLFQRGDLHADLPALRAVGYRQAWAYLAGEIDYATMRERGIVATRQLAKRQMTWLRGWHDLSWITTDEKRSNGESRALQNDEILERALNILA